MLTVKDVCNSLGVSVRTVYRLIQSGKLPAKRFAGQWRFEQRDLNELLRYKSPEKYVGKPDLMTLNEVCEYLGLSRFTIYRLIKSRKLQGIKSGGRWRFSKAEVKEFLFRRRDVPLHLSGFRTEGGILDLNEVSQVLGVSRWTVYRLVKEGRLPASKIAGVWRFIRTEVGRYILDRKYKYGTTAVKGLFFWTNVLDKYYNDKQRYYVQDSAYDGFVGSKQDYHDSKTLKSIHAERPEDKFFAELHYRKVPIKGGFILVLTPKQYQSLPAEEYTHWSEWLIPSRRLREVEL